jgi:cyclic pyranopterin phosphate synthase
MPTTPFDFKPKENLLSVDELFLFIKHAIDEGIQKIRITGGEPTLREDLPELLSLIFNYKKDTEIALTTNGLLMDKFAKKYADAGLKRVNISLDSLKQDVAAKIAGKDILDSVLKGIDASIEAGLRVKLNMVPLVGYNENEIADILEYSRQKGIMLRYIEQMANVHAPDVIGMKAPQILEFIAKKHDFKDEHREFRSPAKLYSLNDGYLFGVIEPHKDDFCESCNRVRLSAEGTLIPCLYFDDAVSIKEALEQQDGKQAIEIFKKMLQNKPLKNKWSEGEGSNRAFYYTGG